LGLSICKAIIEKFGGTINFTSKLNEKTVFYFDLPKADVAFHVIENKNIHSKNNEDNRKILICEDDKEQAEYVQALLQPAGYEVDIASNVVEARRLLMENDYQALLLDLLLPDKDGIAFMRELRDQEKTRELPIIVMSIIAQVGRALLNGNAFSVLDWMDKPVDFSKLLASVERLKKTTAKEMPRILHVEDNADTRDVIATLLQEHARIHGVASLQEAHEELQKNKFDLVILDLILPDGNGVEILPLLSEYQLPVIVFSSVELDNEYVHYVNNALVKSELTTDDLLNTIKKIIHTSH
jgi:DNA-binding response OmpR family regulator